jgi:hypothetical protein
MKDHLIEQIQAKWSDLTQYDSIRVVSRIKRLPIDQLSDIFDGIILTAPQFDIVIGSESQRHCLRMQIASVFDILGIDPHEFGVQFDPSGTIVMIYRKFVAESGGISFGNDDLNKVLI